MSVMKNRLSLKTAPLLVLAMLSAVSVAEGENSGIIRGKRSGPGGQRGSSVAEGDQIRPEGMPRPSVEERVLLQEFHELCRSMREGANAELKAKIDAFDLRAEEESQTLRHQRAQAFFGKNQELRKTLLTEAIAKLKAIQKPENRGTAAKLFSENEKLFSQIPLPPQGGRGGPMGSKRGERGMRGGPRHMAH